jgi:SAM-dependent methyltransferase
VDTEYARSYRELYQRHWWWRAREALLLDTLRALSRGRNAQNILDVGCGSGLFFDRLAEFGSVEGVESDASLAFADRRYRDRIHVGTLADFQTSRSYDLILMLDVLEHIAAAEDALRLALSLLAVDGRIVITVPAFPLLWTHHDVINHHVMRYTRSSRAQLVQSAGGRIERSSYFFHWTFPAKLTVRLLERVLGPGAAERVPPPFINRFLYYLSRGEQRVVGSVGIPFGTSLLAVCVK